MGKSTLGTRFWPRKSPLWEISLSHDSRKGRKGLGSIEGKKKKEVSQMEGIRNLDYSTKLTSRYGHHAKIFEELLQEK